MDIVYASMDYYVAKKWLERKFEGKRHQISIYFEDPEKLRQIRPEHDKDLVEFSNMLEITVIKLKEADQHYELGNGSLYSKLTETSRIYVY